MALFRGAGGAVWDITPPAPGSPRRRQFDEQIASGELVPVEKPAEADDTEPTPRKRAPRKPAEES